MVAIFGPVFAVGVGRFLGPFVISVLLNRIQAGTVTAEHLAVGLLVPDQSDRGHGRGLAAGSVGYLDDGSPGHAEAVPAHLRP